MNHLKALKSLVLQRTSGYIEALEIMRSLSEVLTIQWIWKDVTQSSFYAAKLKLSTQCV